MIHCVTVNCANPSVSYYSHASALAAWNRRGGLSHGEKDQGR